MARKRDDWMPPQLATLTADAPEGPDWVHEIKYDGYRLVAYVHGTGVRLLTRNRKDWTDRFPTVADALAGLGLKDAVLDGELAVEVEGGLTSFQALQNALSRPEGGSLRFFLFDVLRSGGRDVRRRPLVERKQLLRDLFSTAEGVLRYSDHMEGRGAEFFREACAHGLEGIISKRRDAPYQGGRGTAWLKVKCVREQEFVIGGFTEPSGSRSGLGALHVGAWEGDRLIYRGKVGTGFSDRVLSDLRRRLDGLTTPASPFADGPRGAAARGSHWVRPELVARIRFTDITDDGRLRHPSFDGLREDKPPREVQLEVPVEEESALSASGRSPVTSRSHGRGRTASAGRRSTPAKSGTRGSAVQVGGVRLTSPGKVLYPEQALTKLDLAEYYRDIAEWILPHIRNRPLTLVRCPAGRGGSCFFQKHIDDSAPEAIRRVEVVERDGPETYGMVDSVEGLISLAQLGALELHTFNVRADQLEKPDRFLIDLDPDEGMEWDRVVEAAGHVRQALEELGLECFVKTTGGKGLHVVVPLIRRSEWEEVRVFSRAVASLLADALPDRYTLDVSKRKRKGRLLLDYLRNARGATAIEAYSTRARHGAPVATPIAWEELHEGVRPDSFSVSNIRERLATLKEDPWKDYGAVRQSLTAPMKRKLGL
jgi:bifunctional non-homologous end joining protein LigD